MNCSHFQYSNHAIAQMFKRGISANDVEAAIKNGDIIKDYPNDKPFPSCLMLYFVSGSPIHVVVSQDATSNTCYIITAYQPAPANWSADFRTKI